MFLKHSKEFQVSLFFVLPSVLFIVLPISPSFVLPSNPSFVLPSVSEASFTSFGTAFRDGKKVRSERQQKCLPKNIFISAPVSVEAVQKKPLILSCRALARHLSLRSGRCPHGDPSACTSGGQKSKLRAIAEELAQKHFYFISAFPLVDKRGYRVKILTN